ncbi:MAG: ABC transporter substrate-binding protein, partial [Candidatus Dormibacteraceae bacterium]
MRASRAAPRGTCDKARGRAPFLAALIGLLLLLAACGSTTTGGGGTQSNKPTSGGTLTVGIQTPPDSLDPDEAPAAEDYRVMRQIFDSLVYLTPQGVFKPWLATSWALSNGGKTYTFKLRTGVKFQDGTPFNAA